MKRFLKIDSDISTLDLLAIDVMSSDVRRLETSKIDTGFVAEQITKDLLRKKKISERDLLQFRLQCKAFLQAVCQKMLFKCPLKFKLTRCLACLDPNYVKSRSQEASRKFKGLLECLVECKRIQSDNH